MLYEYNCTVIGILYQGGARIYVGDPMRGGGGSGNFGIATMPRVKSDSNYTVWRDFAGCLGDIPRCRTDMYDDPSHRKLKYQMFLDSNKECTQIGYTRSRPLRGHEAIFRYTVTLARTRRGGAVMSREPKPGCRGYHAHVDTVVWA